MYEWKADKVTDNIAILWTLSEAYFVVAKHSPWSKTHAHSERT